MGQANSPNFRQTHIENRSSPLANSQLSGFYWESIKNLQFKRILAVGNEFCSLSSVISIFSCKDSPIILIKCSLRSAITPPGNCWVLTLLYKPLLCCSLRLCCSFNIELNSIEHTTTLISLNFRLEDHILIKLSSKISQYFTKFSFSLQLFVCFPLQSMIGTIFCFIAKPFILVKNTYVALDQREIASSLDQPH